MSYNMNGHAAIGDNIDLTIVNASNDRCLYISNEPACNDSYGIQFIDVRGKDLDLLYETLKEFLGK